MVLLDEEQYLVLTLADEEVISLDEEQHLVSILGDEVMVLPDKDQLLAKFEVALIELEEFDGKTTSRKEGDWHICHFSCGTTTFVWL